MLYTNGCAQNSSRFFIAVWEYGRFHVSRETSVLLPLHNKTRMSYNEYNSKKGSVSHGEKRNAGA